MFSLIIIYKTYNLKDGEFPPIFITSHFLKNKIDPAPRQNPATFQEIALARKVNRKRKKQTREKGETEK